MGIWKGTVRISHPNLGGFGSNTWHVRTTTSEPDVVEITENLGDLEGMISDFYAGLTTVLSGGTVISHDGLWSSVDEDEATQRAVTGFTVNVSGTSLTMAPQDCVVVGWRTSSPTRGGRGRTFIGPLDVDVLDSNGTLKSADLTTFRVAADALVADSTSSGNGAVGVYSRAGVSNPADNGILRDVTAVVVHDKFAVLRSRRD